MTEDADPPPLTWHQAEINNVRIGWAQTPARPGRPPVIFTHGGGPGSTSWNNFMYNAAGLATGRQCYFYDMPQFGASECVAIAGPIYDFHAACLLGFINHLGLERADFVNQSFGGNAALNLAAEHPARVGNLVLVSSQPFGGGVMAPMTMSTRHGATLLSDYYFAGAGPSLAKMRALIGRVEMHDEQLLPALTVKLRYEASIDPARLALQRQPRHQGQPQSLLAKLARNRSRTLIIWGLHDWFGGVDTPLLMLNQFADARLYVIRNAGHHPQTECPEEFNAAVTAFLDSNPTGGAP